MQETVTVIMSTYNASDHIQCCLESLSRQTYDHFKVKIIDDASVDDTVTRIKEWCAGDCRFQLVDVHKENRGLTRSLNELLHEAGSELVARMDSDDICLPDRLKKQVSYLARHGEVSAVGTWAYDIDDRGNILKIRSVPEGYEDIKKILPAVNPLIHSSTMFRKKDILAIGGYDERYKNVQDYDLWFRCISNNLILANIQEPLIKYRVNHDHVNKRGIKYRLMDARIRWNGTRLLGYPLYARLFYTSIPVILGLVPVSLKRLAMKSSDYIDPRQSYQHPCQRETKDGPL